MNYEKKIERKFLNRSSLKKVLKFHYSTSYLDLDSEINANISWINEKLTEKDIVNIQENAKEIIYFTKNKEKNLKFTEENNINFRKATPLNFNKKKIKINILSKILQRSFNFKPNKTRTYPSAGGLYPIELFLGIDKSNFQDNIKTGLYHYNMKEKELCFINSHNIYKENLLKQQVPSFILLYFINIERAIVKYDNRGYRHALIETGIMSNLIDNNSNILGLSTKCWSSFDDRRLCKIFDFNSNLMLPVMIQMIGNI